MSGLGPARRGEPRSSIELVEGQGRDVRDSSLTSGERSLMDSVPGAIVAIGGDGLVCGWNTAAERLVGRLKGDVLGRSLRSVLVFELPDSNGQTIRSRIDRMGSWAGPATVVDAQGERIELRLTATPLRGLDSREGFIVVASPSVDPLLADRREDLADDRFRAFVAAEPNLAVIKDGDGRYIFANDAALILMGQRAQPSWRGRSDDELWDSGVAAQLRDADVLALARGSSIEGELVVTAPDGVHTILLTTFPLSGARGQRLVGSVGLDISDRVRRETRLLREQENDARDARIALERAAVASALIRLRSVAGIDASAAAICRGIHALPGLALASIILFELDGSGTPIGVAAAFGPPRALPRLRQADTQSLRDRAANGPMIEAWASPVRHPHSRTLRQLAIDHVAYAPIHAGDALVGVLMVGGSAERTATDLAELLPAIAEFAELAGALLSPGISGRLGYRSARGAILAVIRDRAFQPVYQPIVDLASGVTIGYEALTRFDDRVDPGHRFAEAAAVDLGIDLELATLEASLAAAVELPTDAWLSVNVSPRLVLTGQRLRTVLRRHQRPLVLELTEHEAIADYPAIRAQFARLPGLRLAIDDAGAGFASFRHILELRPSFVKVDGSLVTGIDGDPIRRELFASIGTFVRAAGGRLIAEGIETGAELAVLTDLGVEFGQGYLLGRPAPVQRPAEPARLVLLGHGPSGAGTVRSAR